MIDLDIVEGGVTMAVAISAVFILPDLPTNSRGFTEEELYVARLRMTEDVGEADVDSEEQGPFDGLKMALKDIKIYIMMLTFTAYVVGLSFNAFFVSAHGVTTRGHFPANSSLANSHSHAGFLLRSDAAYERSPMGVLLHCLPY